MEPSLNGRIMWADIKGKVNKVTVHSGKQLRLEMLDGTEVECESVKWTRDEKVGSGDF